MDQTTATAQFMALVTGPEESVALDRSALLIAAHASPDLDLAHELGRLDELAATCPGPSAESRAPSAGSPAPSAEDLRRYLFETLGFTGDRQHYDHPRNSMLDEVLNRRLGIPITLSVIMLEVGRRMKIPLYGVAMPGHFLVGEGQGRYVDAFERGRVLDAAGCRRQYHSVLGEDAPWDRSFLAPVGAHVILARILANLRQLYTSANDLDSLSWVLRLRAGVPGVDPDQRLELAGVLAALGRYDEAATALDELATADPAEDRAQALRGRALQLRARLN